MELKLLTLITFFMISGLNKTLLNQSTIKQNKGGGKMPNGNYVYFTKQNANVNDLYKSVNTFSGHKRTKNKTFELMSFYLDIDFKDVKDYDGNDPFKFACNHLDKIIARCIELDIPRPSKINFSGNGLHVFWKIKNINDTNENGKSLYGANARECYKVYSHIQNLLVEHFKDLGADTNAKDLARVLRIENTVNSKNNLMCRTLWEEYIDVTIEDMAKLLPYTIDEYKEFKNQPTTLKQYNLAKDLNIEISDKKLVAHKQIAKVMKELKIKNSEKTNENYFLVNDKDYLLQILEKIYQAGYITRGRGVTNNFFYLLGIACKRNGTKTKHYFDKYKELLKLNKTDTKEMYTTYLSGYKTTGKGLNKSYEKIASMLKIDNIKTLKKQKLKRKRTTKQCKIKVFNKMLHNKKYVLNNSCRKIAKHYNISKNLALTLKQAIEEELKYTHKTVLKALIANSWNNVTNNIGFILPKPLSVHTIKISTP